MRVGTDRGSRGKPPPDAPAAIGRVVAGNAILYPRYGSSTVAVGRAVVGRRAAVVLFLFSGPTQSVYYKRTRTRVLLSHWLRTDRGDRGGLEDWSNPRGRIGGGIRLGGAFPPGLCVRAKIRPSAAGGDGMTSCCTASLASVAWKAMPFAADRAPIGARAPVGSPSRERHFLFLRGPFARSFRQVADELTRAAASASTKVVFDGGDLSDWGYLRAHVAYARQRKRPGRPGSIATSSTTR